MADYSDFSKNITRGDETLFVVSVLQDGAPMDLSAFEDIRFMARSSPTRKEVDASILLTLETGEVVVTDAEAGVFEVRMPGSATMGLTNTAKSLYVDIQGTDELTTWTFAQGKLNIAKRVGVISTFSPSQLPGLRCWLRADQGLYQDDVFTLAAIASTDPVGGWKGAGGLTRAFRSGGDPVTHPVKIVDVLDGLPAVRADGVDDYLVGPFLDQFITRSAFTLFLIGRATGGTGSEGNYPSFFADEGAAMQIGVVEGQARLAVYTGGDEFREATATYTMGQYALFEARHSFVEAITTDGSTPGGEEIDFFPENWGRSKFTLTNTSTGSIRIGNDLAVSQTTVPAGQTFVGTTIPWASGVRVQSTTPSLSYTVIEEISEIGFRVNNSYEATAYAGAMGTLDGSGGTTGIRSPAILFRTELGDYRFNLAGDILELIICNVDLTDEDKAKVRTYLSQRYGVPPLMGTVS